MFFEDLSYLSDVKKVTQDKQVDWKRLENKSVLIVGASGMIGTFLIDCLMHKNDTEGTNITVYALGRNLDKMEKRFNSYLSLANFKMLIGDITEPILLEESCDFVLHCASNTHPKSYTTDPIGTILTSIEGTKNVLDYSVAHEVEKVLFLSTVEVYGENRGDVDKFTESYSGYIDCNTLRAGYPEGKRASEALCQAYIQKYNLDIVIPRLSRIFGPTMLVTDSKASSQFILKAVNNEDIILKSEGNQYYSYCYTADAVSALLFLLINGKSGEAYNVANPEFDITLKELAENFAKQASTKVVFDIPDQTEALGFSKATHAILDIKKIENLGWSPIFSLNESINNTLKAMKTRSY